MADPETVARLISTTALMRGERELLAPKAPVSRDRPDAHAQPQEQPAAARALINDSKVVSTVLFAMLDEKLQSAPLLDKPVARDTGTEPSRPEARLAASDAVARQTAGIPAAAIDTPGSDRTATFPGMGQVAAPLVPSGDLQVFLQKLTAIESRIGRDVPGRASARDDAEATFGIPRGLILLLVFGVAVLLMALF